jgi:hypothetical protein
MLKKSLTIITLAVILLSSNSCNKELPEIGGTSAQSLANEWWVGIYQGTTNLYGAGHLYKLITSNTAANTNQIWVDDQHHLWDFKVKAQADFNALTFSAAKAQNEYYNITVDITNGKVIKGAGRSKSGNVTDSIYMDVKFSDDPTNTYQIKGHSRTSFIEDEY